MQKKKKKQKKKQLLCTKNDTLRENVLSIFNINIWYAKRNHIFKDKDRDIELQQPFEPLCVSQPKNKCDVISNSAMDCTLRYRSAYEFSGNIYLMSDLMERLF